jgi:hypothetical protein
MNFRRIALPLLFFLALLPAVGCDKATPVAPTGTVLTLSANPSKIGLNGRSTITIVGRKPDGNPLNPGTEVRLTTDRGTIDPVVTVGDGGVATATLRADGRPGTAMVTAATADASVDTSVQIGESDDTRPSLLVSVNPSIIPTEGTAEVTVIARNADGSPAAAGQQITLTTTLGTLSNARPVTQADGTARAILTAGKQAGTATVTAVLGSSEAATSEVEIRGALLTLTANTTAIPEQATSTITITATVTDFKGDPVSGRTVTFRADRGTLRPTSDTTDAEGEAVTILTINAASVDVDDTFQVTASTPSGSGEVLTETLNITIENTIR